MNPHSPPALVYTLAFTSGFIIMSMELLGGPLLAPYFGGSVYVWGSIISVFMLALAAGYLVGGQLSIPSASLRRFGLLFIVGAALLAPLPWINETVMAAIFDRVEDPRFGSLLACLSLFFLPTFVLGTLSPYAVRLLVENTERSGAVAGRLYFVSTAGSAFGTLMTSFYFVLWFEMNTLFLLLAASLALAGSVAVVVAAVGRSTEGGAADDPNQAAKLTKLRESPS
ncbi:MAG: fused MFS/spermidine synthase [Pseudomonadota bacterium]